MVEHSQKCNARQRQPRPPHGGMSSKRAESGSCEHHPVCGDSSKEVRARKTGDEGEVRQEEGGCQSPVHEAEPEDGTEDTILRVGDMFILLHDGVVIECYALLGGEGEVSDE